MKILAYVQASTLRPDCARKKWRLRRNKNAPSSFITNNANHCHSGFFAKVGLGRSTVLDNAKNTGMTRCFWILELNRDITLLVVRN